MTINPILQSTRFTLTPVEDTAESNAHLIEMMRDKEVQRYVNGHALDDEEIAQALVRVHSINNIQGQGFWLIYNQSMYCVGMCLLKPMPTLVKTSHIETGYWIKHAFWGNGIAAEVAARLIEYAFEDLQLHCVTAVVDEENIGSIKSLEKAGLKKEGTINAYGSKLPFYRIRNPRA